MKAIIYAGIGLFSVATVYGIADYYTTQKKGTLDNLYKDQEEVSVESEVKTVATIVPAKLEETAVTSNKVVAKTNKKSRKRTIRLDDFSRGRIEEPINIVQPVKEYPQKEVVTPVIEVKAETTTPSVVEKKEEPRKFSFDQFSRAPLRNPVKKMVAKKN